MNIAETQFSLMSGPNFDLDSWLDNPPESKVVDTYSGLLYTFPDSSRLLVFGPPDTGGRIRIIT